MRHLQDSRKRQKGDLSVGEGATIFASLLLLQGGSRLSGCSAWVHRCEYAVEGMIGPGHVLRVELEVSVEVGGRLRVGVEVGVELAASVDEEIR